jgi:sugar lactone lactonase YvrE
MRRALPATTVGLISLALVAAPVSAQDGLDRIEMPAGWAPEGITTDGTTLYAGSLANGAILQADPATGETSVLVEGEDGLIVAGIEYDDYGRLWAAGATGAEVRAYDAATGELLGTYPFQAGFLNDLVATPDAVYVSDSFVPQVAIVPLGEDGALPEPDATSVVPISGDLEYGEGFNANGVVATPAGLVIIHSGLGQLFRVDPATGESTLIDSGDVELTAGDGLELTDSLLHVMRNRMGEIVSLELDEALTSATLVGSVTSEDFDVPTTVAQLGDDLWVVNARFGMDPTPETEYWMSRVDVPTGAEE